MAIGDHNGHVGLGVKCSKEVATAIRGAIIAAKLSVIPVRRGYWGNKIGQPHTVPCKVFHLFCGEVKCYTDCIFEDCLYFLLRSLENAVQCWSVLSLLPEAPVLYQRLYQKNYFKWLVWRIVIRLLLDKLLRWATLQKYGIF